MNIINTVGDLKRALEAYDPDLPLQVRDTDRNLLSLNNDTQLAHVSNGDYEHFEIVLVNPVKSRPVTTITLAKQSDATRMGQALLDIGYRLMRGELEYNGEGGISVGYLHEACDVVKDDRVVTQATGIRIISNIELKVKK